MPTMTIGRLAKQAGVNIDTIRYYERNASFFNSPTT
jgi:DNA-binding transcriptional MerR regulator